MILFVIGCEISVFFAFISYKLLTYRDFSLAYRTYGTGEEKFLAFHGYGRSGEDFNIFEIHKNKDWTIFAIDWFFHHPASFYPEGRIAKNSITKKEVAEMVSHFLDEQGIEKVGLMSHSMGGKVAMTLVEEIPERISKVLFFAADGIKKNFWNGFAVNNKMGRFIFKSVVHYPGWVLGLTKALKNMQLMNEKFYAIITDPLQSKEQRQQLYKTWTSSKNLVPDLRKFENELIHNRIELFGFYGVKDKIIRLKDAEEWAKVFLPQKVIYPLNTGHIILKENLVEDIVSILEQD
ncbi:MAG: alpha/beta hydrolase [Flavobacteriales bacterium]|nr:alpha/beta hydrolase [Flavobacteriales bacterium]